MEALAILVGILFVTVIIVAIGHKLGLPWPALLTVIAGLTILVPGIPEFELPVEMILPIFLPPLLWAMARRTSWSVILQQKTSIVLMSVLLVFVTTFAVGFVSLWLIPGVSLAAALVLGAALAPPDPVAVDAVAEPAGVPRRILSTLQTEGLFNDAASIVAFHVALGAVMAGENPSLKEGVFTFLYSSIAACIAGWLIGRVAAILMNWMTETVARNAFTWVIPFATYIIAEHLHASGVIAVVIAAVEMHSRISLEAEDRLSGHAFWETVEMLFTGVAFGLIGLAVRPIVYDAGASLTKGLTLGVLISVVLVGVRLAWMEGMYLFYKGKGLRGVAPIRQQEVLLMTWAGMRGLVTLALVLSIPSYVFPDFRQVPVVALVVLTFTMVLPGLTLPWLMKRLSLDQGPDAFGDEMRRVLQKRSWQAAMGAMHRHEDEIPRKLLLKLDSWFAEESKIDDPDDETLATFQMRNKLAEIRKEAIDAAQQELLRARREPGIDPAIVDELLTEVDRMALAEQQKR